MNIQPSALIMAFFFFILTDDYFPSAPLALTDSTLPRSTAQTTSSSPRLSAWLSLMRSRSAVTRRDIRWLRRSLRLSAIPLWLSSRTTRGEPLLPTRSCCRRWRECWMWSWGGTISVSLSSRTRNKRKRNIRHMMMGERLCVCVFHEWMAGFAFFFFGSLVFFFLLDSKKASFSFFSPLLLLV